MLTCLCNVDPLSSHLDVVKLRFIGAIHYFLNFALKIDCEYSCTHNLCFEQKRKKITIFHMKIIVFSAVKNCSILHRRVIVMKSFESVNGSATNSEFYIIKLLNTFNNTICGRQLYFALNSESPLSK